MSLLYRKAREKLEEGKVYLISLGKTIRDTPGKSRKINFLSKLQAYFKFSPSLAILISDPLVKLNLSNMENILLLSRSFSNSFSPTLSASIVIFSPSKWGQKAPLCRVQYTVLPHSPPLNGNSYPPQINRGNQKE